VVSVSAHLQRQLAREQAWEALHAALGQVSALVLCTLAFLAPQDLFDASCAAWPQWAAAAAPWLRHDHTEWTASTMDTHCALRANCITSRRCTEPDGALSHLFQHIVRTTSLRQLTLRIDPDDDFPRDCYSHFPVTLTHLTLYDTHFDDAQLEQLGHLVRLQELHLINATCLGDGWPLAFCSTIQVFEQREEWEVDDGDVAVIWSDEGWARLCDDGRVDCALRRLSVTIDDSADQALLFAHAPHLEYLDLDSRSCDEISLDVEVQALPPQLRVLKLSHSGGDLNVEHLLLRCPLLTTNVYGHRLLGDRWPDTPALQSIWFGACQCSKRVYADVIAQARATHHKVDVEIYDDDD